LKKQTFAKLRKQEAKFGSAVSPTSFDIVSWAAQSTAATMAENDDVFGKDSPWTKERVLEDWDVSLEYARNKLIEKIKGRIAFLEEILSIVKSVGMCKCSYRCNRHWLIFGRYFHHIDLGLSQILDVFQLLRLTYPRYGDEKSQTAVEAVWMELVLQDERRENSFGVTEQIIGWLATEVGRYAQRNSAE